MTLNNHLKCSRAMSLRHCVPNLGYNTKITIDCVNYTTDPDTAEVIVLDNDPAILKMRLNQAKPPQTELTQGSDRDRVYVEGYLIDPLRVNYDLGDRLTGEYMYEGHWVSCEFYPTVCLADNFTEQVGLHNATGRKIAGYLKLEAVN